MTRFPSSLAHISPATYDYGGGQHEWLDGLSDAEYAALARAFFEVAKHDEHHQAFLRDTREAFQLATGNRDDE